MHEPYGERNTKRRKYSHLWTYSEHTALCIISRKLATKRITWSSSELRLLSLELLLRQTRHLGLQWHTCHLSLKTKSIKPLLLAIRIISILLLLLDRLSEWHVSHTGLLRPLLLLLLTVWIQRRVKALIGRESLETYWKHVSNYYTIILQLSLFTLVDFQINCFGFVYPKPPFSFFHFLEPPFHSLRLLFVNLHRY